MFIYSQMKNKRSWIEEFLAVYETVPRKGHLHGHWEHPGGMQCVLIDEFDGVCSNVAVSFCILLEIKLCFYK